MPPAIIVMTKVPRSGAVKTRLVPPLTGGEAAELAACFIRDAVALAMQVAQRVIVAYTPPEDCSALDSLVPKNSLRMVQQGEDLGQRQEAAIARAAALGFGPLVVVGTDSPTLPASHLTAAIEMLQQDSADLALDPTTDGGYCLLALQKPLPGLLANIAWSTSAAAQQVAEKAASMGVRCVQLPPWYDVDTPADLDRLWTELMARPDATRRAPADEDRRVAVHQA